MRTSPNSQFSHISSLGRGVGRRLSSTAASQKQRVVTLGSGWGGYGLLRGIDKERYGAYMYVFSVIPKTYDDPMNFLTRCCCHFAQYLFQFHTTAG